MAARREADIDAANEKMREWKRNNKSKVREYRRLAAEKAGRTYCSKPLQKEHQWQKAAATNAVQAWQYWLNKKAPSWWLDAYWFATGKPWRDPRLTEAERYRLRYRLDENFAIRERLRRQLKKKAKRDGVQELMRGAIRRNGGSPMVELLLGYSIDDLKLHLERQFTSGMNWEKFKRGEIHIDHIIPQRAFDLSNDDEWRKCWCLSNLQPLWACDNLKKGASVKTLL